jgi:hypothetical protein
MDTEKEDGLGVAQTLAFPQSQFPSVLISL